MALIFRVVGYALLLFSLLVAGAMLVLVLDNKNLSRAAGEVWVVNGPTSYSQVQRGIQEYVSPDLWDNYVVPFLELPAWLAMSITGGAALILAGLFLLGGRRAAIRQRKRMSGFRSQSS